MCLCRATELKVDKPITVYKVLIRTSKDEYFTPFYAGHVPQEVLSGAVPLEAFGYASKAIIEEYGEVEGGFIHSYASLETAVSDFFKYYVPQMARADRYPHLFECRIDPSDEDNYCWEGEFDSMPHDRCIAARRITFVREIDYHEMKNVYKEHTGKFPGE